MTSTSRRMSAEMTIMPRSSTRLLEGRASLYLRERVSLKTVRQSTQAPEYGKLVLQFSQPLRLRPEAKLKVLSVYPKEMTEGKVKLPRDSRGVEVGGLESKGQGLKSKV